ncbi:MAG: iron-containing alcohol dehydrogenase [Anaerolineae bacterium]|nr:iron-containing alcohol dehydrogenase [Anaerolineae bacterium]MCA9888224.1 iron-containing alcohol dehydrogenase [Anaerolineae bacterium]MCA9891713.1 iron-containing alcohol dehydrogenase [Anaerolineae bacterium]MCB9461820.1 iron-containing alcohol dehydrogenase [Anaerolineaceae bacterium]
MAIRETIWNLPRIEVIDDLGSVVETRPAAVLTGNRAWNAVGSLLNLPIVVQAEPRTAEQGFLDSLAEGLPEHVEVVYGIGGGLAADSAKYVAHKANKPAVIIPTALSVDGFFTSMVAVRKDGSVAYESTGPAEKVYVDFDVVSSAPEHIRGTGIVEILSMTTGLLDWKYAADRRKNAPHERYQLWAAQVAASIAQQAYKIADAVGRGSPDALRKLLDLICVEVQLTNQLGHNRPQEGAEQFFAYAIEPRASHAQGVPYSDLVGPGILIAAALHDQNIDPIRDTLLSAGVRLGQLRRDDIVETLQILPDYVKQHNLPYSIINDLDITSEEAQRLLARTGLDLSDHQPL